MSKHATHDAPVTLPRFMQHLPVWLAVDSWLQHLTLDEVINLWFIAQGRKQALLERHAARCKDPHDCYGKSPEWVEEYYTRLRP